MESALTPAESLALDEAVAYAPGARSAVTFGASDTFSVAVRAAFDAPIVRAFTDTIAPDAAAPDGVERHGLTADLVRDADLVVGLLPKALGELEELAGLVASHGSPAVRVVLAGRDKHMSRGMNDTLARAFDDVTASRGRQKSRALRATGRRSDHGIAPFPRAGRIPDLGFDVIAHGGAFAGARLDIGTRTLLALLDDAIAACGVERDAPVTVLDLGSGTGVLATTIALRLPAARVLASDRSLAAVSSSAATARAAGVGDRVEARQEDAAACIEDASVDLVVLNPPFHDGHTVDEDMATRLFAAAARVLRPGGSLLTVYNSHLPHRGALSRIVGPTTQLHRTPKFTVTRSIAR